MERTNDIPTQVHILGERIVVLTVNGSFKRSCRDAFVLRAPNATSMILVVVFRDPVEWVGAMHEKPYHSPRHVRLHGDDSVPLNWHSLVTNQRYAGSDYDRELKSRATATCRQEFPFNQVVHCWFDNGRVPLNIEESTEVWGLSPLFVNSLRRDGSGENPLRILPLLFSL